MLVPWRMDLHLLGRVGGDGRSPCREEVVYTRLYTQTGWEARFTCHYNIHTPCWKYFLLPAKFKHRPPMVNCWAMVGQISEGTINSVETPQAHADAFYI